MAHIRKSKSGGGWEARYRDPMGKERARTFRTKRDAELFLGRQSADIQRGDHLDPRLARTTFARWAEEWLSTTVHLKPKTQASYKSILRKRVLPTFGAAPIASVEQVDVRRFVAERARAGDEAGTIRNTFNVLRLVFGVAVASGAIRANPCTGVRMPRSTRSEMLFLEPAQVLELADAITPSHRTLVLVAAYTGLRAGEIGALRVGRVDLLRGTADVRESLADVNGKLVFGPTETYSQRTVRLPRFLCDDLAAHLASRAGRPDDRRLHRSFGLAVTAQPVLGAALQARGPPRRAPGSTALP